ncbi:hypothetical protein TNCV_2070261 [Trichonephila clavipes]|uniref:Uncharacterized protein n=1 Tax=Trichonephila clavipes TaxID=2585209 RepID=A0A8X7BD22_TRICX|nr:hypothetical protein TNCV_2070261 [Trichonephila clavipes]
MMTPCKASRTCISESQRYVVVGGGNTKGDNDKRTVTEAVLVGIVSFKTWCHKILRTIKVLRLKVLTYWTGGEAWRLLVQILYSARDRGSKLRGPSPIQLMSL